MNSQTFASFSAWQPVAAQATPQSFNASV